ncbi:MAG: hypothetical protein HY368_01655 [Candidatus Aenigmarchaeota archaeon]|nr:hypothetical protein [Candidatus Aenigmarchaeota archaeon]
MKAIVAKSPIGVFAFSEDGELLYYRTFSSEPSKALQQFESNIDKDFIDDLKDYVVAEEKAAWLFLRKHFREYALSLGFAKSNEELNKFLSEFAALLSRRRMKEQLKRDRLLIQASAALEDAIKIENLLGERFREWYSLHYPELKNVTPDMVLKHGTREMFPGYKESVGVQLTESDLQIITEHARLLKEKQEYRKGLEKYIRNTAKELMPNFSSLIEPVLAARFLALAGSLEKLAKMPASTLQLLGAEKALFRHLREKGKSPKYGILFLDSRIHAAPEQQRGKIARTISSKLMQAARIDFYSGRDESARMRSELDEEIRKIREERK